MESSRKVINLQVNKFKVYLSRLQDNYPIALV